MTDAVQTGTEWVPAIGKLEGLPPEHTAVIRGLFEVAAFVADHLELPAPDVDASFYTGRGDWESQRAVVDQVAGALGERAIEEARRGSYGVKKLFGPVRAWASAFTAESMDAYQALLSYSDNVKPATVPVEATGGAR